MSKDVECGPASGKASGGSRDIWRLAWPQTLMMIFHFFIGFVDVVVAGRIGREVQAAQGVLMHSLIFFLIVAVAVANGSVASISQSAGACLRRRVERYIGLSLELAAMFGVFILAVGFLAREPFLDLLRIPPDIRPVVAYMFNVYMLILPAYYLLIITNAIFRAQRMVHIPLFAMILITSVNTIGDLGFGLGWLGMPDFGYKGLAWATFGSVLCGALFNLFVLACKGQLKNEAFPPLRWIKPAFRYLFKVAWPQGLMQILWQGGFLALFAVVGALPREAVDALAGMAAGLRVESALFLPAFAFNMTASIMVGNFLGAGDPAGAKRTGGLILGLGSGLMSALALVIWIGVDPVIAFIAPEPHVQPHVKTYLAYNLAAIPFTVGTMILGGIMAGAGATLYTMFTFGITTWLVRVPMAYAAGHVFDQGPSGVWLSMLVSQAIMCSTLLYLFLFKNWSRFSMRGGRQRPAAGVQTPGARNAAASV